MVPIMALVAPFMAVVPMLLDDDDRRPEVAVRRDDDATRQAQGQERDQQAGKT